MVLHKNLSDLCESYVSEQVKCQKCTNSSLTVLNSDASYKDLYCPQCNKFYEVKSIKCLRGVS